MEDQTIKAKTLEQLEGEYWKEPPSFPTKLVENVFALRKIPLKDLDINDIRILLSQNVGLKYLVPDVLCILQKNILEESLYYPGDLLLTLLKIDDKYWLQNSQIKEEFSSLLKINFTTITTCDDLDTEVKEEIVAFTQKFLH